MITIRKIDCVIYVFNLYFKIIYLSLSTSRKKKLGDQDLPGSAQFVPAKESSPTLLLLRPKNFEVLFRLMHTLGSMKTIDEEEVIKINIF